MRKPAPAAFPIHELIRERWSPRAFADRPVDDGTLCTLFEAARWAPSAWNEQPWEFIVGTRSEPEQYERVLSCLNPNNVRWAQKAPVLLIAVAKLHRSNGELNRWAYHDVGLACAQLTLQARALGMYTHFMAGFQAQKAKELFAIPEGREPVVAMAIGYPGDPRQLPEDLRERELLPRERKPLMEFVYGGTWGRPAPFIAGGQ